MSTALSDAELPLALHRQQRALRTGSKKIVQDLAAKYVPGTPYRPDLEAYRPDPDNELDQQLDRELADPRKRVEMTVSAIAYDGQRETISLNEAETRDYLKANFLDRRAMQNSKIVEQRFRVAKDAADRLAREGGTIGPRSLKPFEEAALREFGALENRRTRVNQPGEKIRYEMRPRLVEDWSRKAGTRTGKQMLEDFYNRRAYDGQPGGFGYDNDLLPGSVRGRNYQYGPMQYAVQLSDIWDEQAKTTACWRTDPFCKQGVKIRNDFVFGRGVDVIAADKGVQAIIDEFNGRHKMKRLLKQWGTSASVKGELFLRLVPIGNGYMNAIKLPAASIWEVWTASENVNAPYVYVQRYTTRYQLYNPGTVHYITREIAANEVLHLKLNVEDDEVRGRSDVYANLGWHRRLTNFWDAAIRKETAAAAYQFDVTLTDATEAEVTAYASNNVPEGEPEPGGSFVHNDKAKVEVLDSKAKNSAANGSASDGITNVIACGYGFTKEYFGIRANTSRGGVLTAAEPSTKSFEERQDDWGQFLDDMYRAIIDEAVNAGLLAPSVNRAFKIRFPAISKTDALVRTELLQIGVENHYCSMRTAAPIWASETEVDDFDYDAERLQIVAEEKLGIGPAGSNLLPKSFDPIDPPAPPGGPGAPGAPADKPGVAIAKKAMGLPSKPKGAPSSLARPGVAIAKRAQIALQPNSMAGGAKTKHDDANARNESAVAEAMELLQAAGAVVLLP